jgi:cytochrome c6
MILSLCAMGLLLWSGGCQQQPAEKAKPAAVAEKPAPQAAAPAPAPTEAAKSAAGERWGGELFKELCAMCHAGGGNIINPKKTLSKADREAHGVHTVEDILHIIRNPGPGMARYHETTLPDDRARLIAQYILDTFN